MDFRKDIEHDLHTAFIEARSISIGAKDSESRISHVVYAILLGNNIVSQVVINELNAAGVIDDMMTHLKGVYEAQSNQLLANKVEPERVQNHFEANLQKVINECFTELEKGQLISVEALFLKILETEDASVKTLHDYGLATDKLRKSLDNVRMASNVNMSDEDEDELGLPKRKKTSKTPFLDDFGRDLTEMAKLDQLDPVYNRDEESERVAQVLARRKKNNPVLVGEPGIGKTAIIEKLAISIHTKQCPPPLFDKRVISIDLAALVAGTKYRGQFEERIKKLIEEVRNSPDVILFIDEIHMLVGAGNAAGSMDAANI